MGAKLTPLDQIFVPAPKADETYTITMLDREYSFTGLKALLGAADLEKSGDRNAGLAARDEVEREAARAILSDMTLQHLYDRPLTDNKGQVDSVMRVNYDIDMAIFNEISAMTIGELKDHLLEADAQEVRRIGFGMTGVMVSAVAKIMDVHDMIFATRKIRRPTKARTSIGMPNTLSSRIQPNHPTDDLTAITAQLYIGMSMGSGDLMFGLNPAEDTVENISSCLHLFDKVRREHGVPTQICVLSHIKTQLQCLENGAPVEMIFQSLAGTDATLVEEFDVTVDLLDEACRTMAAKGPLLKDGGVHQIYFETGQGSEFSYNKHNGIDMATTEALTYGLCRRYDPCMVNNVTGFIGPETHATNHECIYSSLQDHFMGKLIGLPMGMAPCYTLHADITMEGQQMATSLLSASGANYYMDVYLGADRMLAYFDTSGHDDQTMREIYNYRTTPEHYQWCLAKGIFKEDEEGNITRGENWGNPRMFCKSDEEFQALMESVPQNYGFSNTDKTVKRVPTAGPRMKNSVARELRSNIAIAREAARSTIRMDEFAALNFRRLDSEAGCIEEHHNAPDMGARLNAESLAKLSHENRDIQIVVTDGLSAEAVHHSVPDMLPVLEDGLRARGYTLGQTIVVPHGRVKLSESIAEAINAKVVIMLLGERPGGDARSSRSMSAYMVYNINDEETRSKAVEYSGDSTIGFEDTVVNNIYYGGIPPIEAGALVAERTHQILVNKAAGNRLNTILGASLTKTAKAEPTVVAPASAQQTAPQAAETVDGGADFSGQKLISEADIRKVLHGGACTITIRRGALITPAARDLMIQHKIETSFTS
ncbi:ethanolamine ammonia-lyase subunit EutB [Parendozoicomonas haliclonae]|uniref:Ethanolamine ammonia-lyase heavy chain n=1 Tax=Parendozoicomonas haliclonae TaxID=1960125 RepID=A0A1X7ALB8_9GAMM|nr:ethanolamine ammonia-lyase subunit EutB [Parendozoicomonas haliclonae]SMA48771.1 Ethanolamine ammonia-lyase heavy chain [Parendozoicomonas haliclonae]